MNFLVDECLSPTIAAVLRNAGHDAVHVSVLGMAGQSDDAVMAAARVRNCVVVSADTDFGELLARTNAPLPSVVLYRGREVAPTVLAELLLANLDQFDQALEHGAIVVILDDRIRVRALPLGTDREQG
ncbi:DUF5615 family PIN-like protein [Sporichthya sp.]|uniref:DUF5615 family PIN-like protein n=1 Tax=Sporichthya sp. TaxID=65475 RepID=UPI00180CAFB4|nr:DUF5615 family PIN-like protein [Sporichthya sp.]MBA3743958.1 DUF5615 family PIN-like protein [Sporichthya sp.]